MNTFWNLGIVSYQTARTGQRYNTIWVRNRIDPHKWVWHRTSSTCLIKLTVPYSYVMKPVNVCSADARDADGKQRTPKYRPHYVYSQNSICLSWAWVSVTDCFAYYLKNLHKQCSISRQGNVSRWMQKRVYFSKEMEKMSQVEISHENMSLWDGVKKRRWKRKEYEMCWLFEMGTTIFKIYHVNYMEKNRFAHGKGT